MKFIAYVCTFVFLATVAIAQETTTVRVGDILAPWMEMLLSAVSIIVTAIIAYVANLIRQKTGIDIEARHREALQTALANGAGLIINKLGSSIGDKTIDVRSPLIRDAVNYVSTAAPDAIRNFGLAPDQLAEKLVAKLGLAAAPAAAATATPVTVTGTSPTLP
jgi:uncharacterized membrane protein